MIDIIGNRCTDIP